jgi:hypothetical protein
VAARPDDISPPRQRRDCDPSKRAERRSGARDLFEPHAARLWTVPEASDSKSTWQASYDASLAREADKHESPTGGEIAGAVVDGLTPWWFVVPAAAVAAVVKLVSKRRSLRR